jgi:hypothetical protein
MQISLSTPMIMSGTYVPSWAETEQLNKSYLKKLLAKYPKKYITYTGVKPEQTIYNLVKSKTHEIYFIHAEGMIQYAVEIDVVHTTGKITLSTVSQVSVWRNRSYRYVARLPMWFFGHVLYPRYNTILSDKIQSDDGADFWSKRVMEVLDQSFYQGEQHIYALKIKDRQSAYAVELVNKIETVADLQQYYTREPDVSGEQYRLLITAKPIIL